MRMSESRALLLFARHSGEGRTAEAGCRSEHRRSRWPEGRAAGAARNPFWFSNETRSKWPWLAPGRRKSGFESEFPSPAGAAAGPGSGRLLCQVAQHVLQDAAVLVEVTFLRRQQHHVHVESGLLAILRRRDDMRGFGVAVVDSGDRVRLLAGQPE